MVGIRRSSCEVHVTHGVLLRERTQGIAGIAAGLGMLWMADSYFFVSSDAGLFLTARLIGHEGSVWQLSALPGGR